MIDIDKVLKPYEDEQPKDLIVPCSHPTIQRIPLVVDDNGITREFQTFFDTIVRCVLNNLVDELYDLSDKFLLNEKSFKDMYMSKIGNDINNLLQMPKSSRGIDIELNLSRFEKRHRNLVGGFFIITYELTNIEEQYISVANDTTVQIVQKCTELLFTYKDGKFCILSSMKPFEYVE